MTHIIFDDKKIEIEDGQSVLSALLNHNYEIPNSCQAGVCQSCMLQAVEGDIPATAQAGLKDTLKAQGYFLACSCQPTSPLRVVAANDAETHSMATVIEHELLNQHILRLRLKPAADFNYKAGQFINICKTDTLSRSYSLASVPGLDNLLELHIRRITEGKLSSWLHDEVHPGDELKIQQASGDCFYVPGNSQQKLLLAGTGTGLAPLIGIARDAIAGDDGEGHCGEIHLIHGARTEQDLYLHQTLQAMAKKHSQFHYHTNVLETMSNDDSSGQTLQQQIMQIIVNPEEWKAYLCGDAKIVNQLKMQIFLKGVAMNQIYSDPFVVSGVVSGVVAGE